MKKVLSIILSVIMASSVLCVGVCAEEKNDLSFAVASDLHYSAPEEELEKQTTTRFSGMRQDAVKWKTKPVLSSMSF